MYRENWVLVRKSAGTPHEFVRCATGRSYEEEMSWLEDKSDDFQVEVEFIQCQNASVAGELARARIKIFYSRKFL